MRVMVFVPGDEDSEAGVMPSQELIGEDDEVQRGAGEGGRDARGRGTHAHLEGQARAGSRARSAPSSTGRSRSRRSSSRATGSGRSSRWRRRSSGSSARRSTAASRSTLRPVFEAEDFGKELTPELRAKEEQLRRRWSGSAGRSPARRRRRCEALSMAETVTREAVEAVWRIESARLIGGLVRMVRDVGLAEDLAQEALVVALERWPADGNSRQPRRVADDHREEPRDRPGAPARDARAPARSPRDDAALLDAPAGPPDLEAAIDEDVGDDLLRLMLIACHPVLSTEARVALTLRLLGGLTTDEIARAFLLRGADHRPAHRSGEADARRGAGALRGAARRRSSLRACPRCSRSSTSSSTRATRRRTGADWMRTELCEDALRLGRILAGLVPHEAEVHGLVALMELHASRAAGAGRTPRASRFCFSSRTAAAGTSC